jgi:hypothetical protein
VLRGIPEHWATRALWDLGSRTTHFFSARRVAVSCRLAVVDVPNVQYVRNGDVALAYQVFGDGPVDLV